MAIGAAGAANAALMAARSSRCRTRRWPRGWRLAAALTASVAEVPQDD
jgi:hypothetical protein